MSLVTSKEHSLETLEPTADSALEARWFGKSEFEEVHQIQKAIANSSRDYIIGCEHKPVFTSGTRFDRSNVLDDQISINPVRRGGDVTYHGPGVLMVYPLIGLSNSKGKRAVSNSGYIHCLESWVVDALCSLGIDSYAKEKYPGVWVGDKKICSIGVGISRDRTMHGLALNINPDLSQFDRIIPCGITDVTMTSISELGISTSSFDFFNVMLKALGDSQFGQLLTRTLEKSWRIDYQSIENSDDRIVSTATATQSVDSTVTPVKFIKKLNNVGVATDQLKDLKESKPPWLRAKAEMSEEFLELNKIVESKKLHTVCKEANCPNIFQCWKEATATFMINGKNCTRNCSFCLIDHQKPEPLDADEPKRVAKAVKDLGVTHAVVTVVARDDLEDGGATAVAKTIQEIRAIDRDITVEVLISDCQGKQTSLNLIFDEKPDVLNHNIETVARLSPVVRPSAKYWRSLSVLAKAKSRGLITKSGLMVGLGETRSEVIASMRDLESVGVDILTIGQYLRPSFENIAVSKWYTPNEFLEFKEYGEQIGFSFVESSPHARSSYKAKEAFEATLHLV